MATFDSTQLLALRKQLLLKRQSYCEALLKQGYRCCDELLLTLYKPNGTFSTKFEWLEQLADYKVKLDTIKISQESRRLFSQLFVLSYEYTELCKHFQISEQ
jgi:hypothetical protein